MADKSRRSAFQYVEVGDHTHWKNKMPFLLRCCLLTMGLWPGPLREPISELREVGAGNRLMVSRKVGRCWWGWTDGGNAGHLSNTSNFMYIILSTITTHTHTQTCKHRQTGSSHCSSFVYTLTFSQHLSYVLYTFGKRGPFSNGPFSNWGPYCSFCYKSPVWMPKQTHTHPPTFWREFMPLVTG